MVSDYIILLLRTMMKRSEKGNVWKIAVACRCAESDDDVPRNGVSGETEAKERCGVDAGLWSTPWAFHSD